MEAIKNFFGWLFGTRTGVLVLMVAGVLIFLLVAWLMEKRMRKQFYNHAKSKDDWDLFDSEEE